MLLFYAFNDSKNSFLFSFLNDTGKYRGGNDPGFVLFLPYNNINNNNNQKQKHSVFCAAQFLIWRPPNAFEST